MNTIEKIRLENVRQDLPEMHVGDPVQIGFRIVEGGKERIQNFAGVIISMTGTGIAKTITVRRVVSGQGVERIVPLSSPRVASIKVTRQGLVRRAKLYYLRKRVGKEAKIRAKVEA